MKLQSEQFKKGVENLRTAFSEQLFRKSFHGKKINNVPVDGFGAYAQAVWSTIRDNKDLDLPSQRTMLALFRCEEIAAQVIVVAVQLLY